MKKELDYQGAQIEIMRSDHSEFVNSRQVETIVDILRRDQKMYTDEQVKDSHKNLSQFVDARMRILNDLPNKRDYISKMEFNIFTQGYRLLEEKVERVSTVLLDGYRAEALHLLKGKVSWPDIQTELDLKLDALRGEKIEDLMDKLDLKRKSAD